MKKYVTDINKNIYLMKEEYNQESDNTSNNIIEIELDNIVSKYLGMGTALTESSAYNYNLLNETNKQKFIKDCFCKEGLNYNYARICIGSSDFSLNKYSYAKKKDLSDFNISYDKKYIIPIILDILKNKKIDIIASPWSPPIMYKKIKILNYGMKLSKKYYDYYASYLIKFIDSYSKEGIFIKYITMQNEPFARQKWESCVFTLDEQKDFIYNYLIPKLNDTKLLLHDHNKDNLYNIYKNLYRDNSKIAGLAFHNYSGSYFDELKKIKENNSSILLINTEGCSGFSKYDEKNWINDAEYYLKDIIGDFNNGCNAYLDWNILLNENGGPSHINNPVKSALILNNDNYIKTPIYYYIYHISHYTDRNMDICNVKSYTKDIDIVSFKNSKKIVTVIMNRKEISYKYKLIINNKYIYDEIKSHNIITYVCNL